MQLNSALNSLEAVNSKNMAKAATAVTYLQRWLSDGWLAQSLTLSGHKKIVENCKSMSSLKSVMLKLHNCLFL